MVVDLADGDVGRIGGDAKLRGAAAGGRRLRRMRQGAEGQGPERWRLPGSAGSTTTTDAPGGAASARCKNRSFRTDDAQIRGRKAGQSGPLPPLKKGPTRFVKNGKLPVPSAIHDIMHGMVG